MTRPVTAIDCFLAFGLVAVVTLMAGSVIYLLARAIATCVIDQLTDYVNAFSRKAEQDLMYWMEAGCQPGEHIANPATKFE